MPAAASREKYKAKFSSWFKAGSSKFHGIGPLLQKCNIGQNKTHKHFNRYTDIQKFYMEPLLNPRAQSSEDDYCMMTIPAHSS